MGGVGEAALEPPGARSNGRLVGWLVFVGILAAVAYGVRLAVDAPADRNVFYKWSTVAGTLVQFGFMLGVVLALAAEGPMRHLLALRPPRSWPAAGGAAAALLVATFAVAAATEPILHAGEEQGLTPERWDPSRALPFAANFVVVAGFVPIVEELTFRGLGFSLLERFGRPVAIVGVGVLFGLAHGLLAALPILVAFGTGLAWLRSRSDSVYPCILLHATFNGLSLIAAVTLNGG